MDLNGKKVMITCGGGVGDIIMYTPALRRLKEKYHCHITFYTSRNYEVIEGLDDVTSNELHLIIKVIEYVRPDIERVRVLYNVYEHDDDAEDDVCLTCDSILDVVRDNEGKFVLNN